MVANRLSAGGRFSVLLLEAGGDDASSFKMEAPLMSIDVCTSKKYIWADFTSPQKPSTGNLGQVS